MVSTVRLSRLMKLSWDIQRFKRNGRSKALQQAWAIVSNEDVTVRYLTKKLNHHRDVPYTTQRQYALFQG